MIVSKIRCVSASDQDWDMAKEKAEIEGCGISELVRKAIRKYQPKKKAS